MPTYTDSLQRLMALLSRLPGVGSRSAERLAFHLLKAPRDDALALADAIRNVKDHVKHCSICFNLTESRGPAASPDICPICADPSRDHTLICVVEQPKDLLQLESTGIYKGTYHVLLGRIAALENISPSDLTIPQLLDRLKPTPDEPHPTTTPQTPTTTPQPPSPPHAHEPKHAEEPKHAQGLNPWAPVHELILATNPTMEGDGTALYIQQAALTLNPSLTITRLARGLPAGAQIEYSNKAILTDALTGRTKA